MGGLYNDIQDLIHLLNTITIGVAEGDYRTYDQNLADFAQQMIITFPRIIDVYSLPEFSNIASDATYWSSQLERLLMVLQQRDQFQFVDVLYFETRQNLLLFCEMIEGMEN